MNILGNCCCGLLLLLSTKTYGLDCIPERDFGMGGFLLNQNETQVRTQLLSAHSVEILTSENSKGEYYFKRYSYDHLLVEIVKNVVGRIYTESRELPAPNGLRVGMSTQRVRILLGVDSLRWNNNMREFYIEPCEQRNLDILGVVTVNEKDSISAIEFVIAEP